MSVHDEPEHYEGKDLESMSNAKNYYNWIISEFAQYIKGVVVEVGAGAGTFSEYIIKQKPQKLYVIEPSIEMGSVLKKKMATKKNVTVLNSVLADQTKTLKGKVDTFFYINVLEHVKEDAEELKLIYDTLKPGGYLCIYVPALNSLLGSFDEKVGHFRRYSKKEMRQKLLDAGFEVKRVNYSDIYGIIPWIVNFKLLKATNLNPKSVTLYDNVAIPVIRTQEKLFKPPIGKNIWAIARKPE